MTYRRYLWIAVISNVASVIAGSIWLGSTPSYTISFILVNNGFALGYFLNEMWQS